MNTKYATCAYYPHKPVLRAYDFPITDQPVLENAQGLFREK